MINISNEELASLKEKGMSDSEIAEYFAKQGKTISEATVYYRLTKYYESIGKTKPKVKQGRRPKIDIPTEELVSLKEKGMSCREIAEYFVKQRKDISQATVYYTLTKYYESIGKAKPKSKQSRRPKIDIPTEELVRLKEKGMSGRKIAEYFAKQGKFISEATVYYRLTKYYESIGKTKPKVKSRIDIPIEEMVRLKEKGMIEVAIAEYFAKQGKSISQTAVNQRLTQYYQSIGKTKPKSKAKQSRRPKIDIPTEEMVRLKEKGMSDREIAKHFAKQGMHISFQAVNQRLTKYYESIGKTKPKVKSRIDIPIEEMVRLKEKGMSEVAIAEYFAKQGKSISRKAVNQRLTQYYQSIGKPKPKAKPKAKPKIDISTEEMVRLKEKGMSEVAIAEYFAKQGKSISQRGVNQRLTKYYESIGKAKPKAKAKRGRKTNNQASENNHNVSPKGQSTQIPKQYKLLNNDIKLKDILMTGQSIKGYCLGHKCEQDEDKIKERMRRLKVIAEHSQKRGEQWITDSNFLEIIRVLESIGNIDPTNKYKVYLRPYLSNGTCKNGNINSIQMNVFKDNKDLMVFILSGCKLRYGADYDVKVWNKRRTEYEAKIDKYFNRLYALEQRAIKKQKEKSEAENLDQKRKTKKGTNPQNPGDER